MNSQQIKQRSSPQSAEYKARWYSKNKVHVDELTRAWRRANPEMVRRNGRAWAASHRDAEYRRHDEWAKAHPEKVREYARNRRARAGKVSSSDEAHIFSEYGGMCVYCNRKADRLELDHVVPLVAGGDNSPGNLVPSCRSCNASKNDGSLLIWMLRRNNELPINQDQI